MAWMRRRKPKRLEDQTIVITGASSGIGLATAHEAARRGARVVMAARNEDDLRRAWNEIRVRGLRATYVVADVADPAAVDHLAEVAEVEFGGIDTWINNAGVSIYGRLTEVPLEDKRRLFDTNFWGVVHGCRSAIAHMRERGGTIINVGSILSDLAIPLQGMYSASKHAVKAYTDALRMELEHDGIPIWLTLVKPSAVDTPFIEHARSYMEKAPMLPPPVYAPEVVASAILTCCEKRVREVTVGGGGRLMTALARLTPRTADLYMERAMFTQQKDHEGVVESQDSLYHPKRDGSATGPYPGHVMRSSAYTRAMLSDVTRMLPLVAVGLVFAASLRAAKQNP